MKAHLIRDTWMESKLPRGAFFYMVRDVKLVKSHLLKGMNSYTLYITTVGLVQRLSRNMSFNAWLRELLDRVDGFVGGENTFTKRNLKVDFFLLTYSLPSLKSSKTFTKRFTLSIFLTFPEEKNVCSAYTKLKMTVFYTM